MHTRDLKSGHWAYLWLALAGILNLFASGKWTFAPAAWLAPVFALIFLHTHPKPIRFLFFYLVYWITLAIPWYGATPIWGPAHFIFMAVNALVGAIPFAVDRLLAPRLRHEEKLRFVATLTYPTAVTALEYLTSTTNPMGNFGALGYSQYAFPALAQLAAVTGLLGLTFLLSWFASIVLWAWDHAFAWKRIRAGVLAYAVLLLAVAGYGSIRLWTAPEPDRGETATVVSFTVTEIEMPDLIELLAEDRDAFRRQTRDVHARYLSMTETAIADGAEIVLWPELALAGLEEDVQAAVEQGQALARQAGIYLAMPTFTLYPDSDRQAENVLIVVAPDGEPAIEHVKYGGNVFEGTLKGSGEIVAVDTPYGKLSGIICWDTNYPGIVRQVGEQRGDILLSPAKEWPGINPLHAEMAVFRAIENGVAVVRQADEGLSIVVDAYGRTLASGEGLVGTGNYLVAEVPVRGTQTLYALIGDVVGLLSTIGFVAIAVYALVAGRRARKSEAATEPVAG
jgi:apolipoprotein N-acyltransferase